MTNKLSGPHFCMGTARDISERIFRELARRAEQAGGQLTTDEIAALSVAFNTKIAGNSRVFEKIYDDCVSTHRGNGSRAFNRKTLPGFVMFAYTIDLMKAAFPGQGARAGKGWYTHMADALIAVAATPLGLDIPGVVNSAYDHLSVERGQALTIDDMVKSHEVAEIIGKFFIRLRNATGEGAETEKLSSAINDVLRNDLQLVGASTLLVNNYQCRDFIRRLETDKFHNPYRKAIYLADSGQSECA